MVIAGVPASAVISLPRPVAVGPDGPVFHVSIISTFDYSQDEAAWESGVAVVFWKVAMTRASQGPRLWLGRVRCASPWPVRYHWYVPRKAAWEPRVAMVFWKVAMVRASKRPGLWSGRVRVRRTPGPSAIIGMPP